MPVAIAKARKVGICHSISAGWGVGDLHSRAILAMVFAKYSSRAVVVHMPAKP